MASRQLNKSNLFHRLCGEIAVWTMIIVLFSGLSFGCAYYNYLYNAKQHYEDGENQRRTQSKSKSRSSSRTSRKSGPYAKCIESAGRLLEYYPDSRWEDDALLLLAKAYYRTDQYRSAITKINELLLKYPESPLVTEGLLWKGMALLKVAQPDSAQLILSRLSGAETDAELRAQAHYALGEYFYDDERWNPAQEQFREVVESGSEDEWLIGEAWIKVGDCLNRLERYEDAVQLYSDIMTAKNPRRLKFIARREQAIALRELGRYDQALELFEELLSDGAYINEFPRVELETARCLRKMGRQDEARTKLELLVETETRGEIAAQANYELGYLLWDHWRDLAGARTALASVKRVDRSSPLTGPADSLVTEMETLYGHWQRLTFLRRQLSLLDSTEKGSRQMLPADTTFIDSLDLLRSAERSQTRRSRGSRGGDRRLDPIERMVEEAMAQEQQEETEETADSTEADHPDSSIFLDSTTVADLSDQRRRELILERFNAASFHLFERNDRDSAGYYYRRVIELDAPPFDSISVETGASDIWARTMASLAYIARVRGDTTASDSLYRLINDELPNTPFGRQARNLLGFASGENEVSDNIAFALDRAETLWRYDSNYTEARDLYLAVADSADSSSQERVRAMLAAAYLSRRLTKDDSLVRALYNAVKEEYRGTDYGRFAQDRLRDLTQIQQDRSRAVEEVEPTEEEEQLEQNRSVYEWEEPSNYDEIGIFDSDVVYDPNDVDELPNLETRPSMLDAHLRSAYPLEAYEEGIRGEVELIFTLDPYGAIFDIEVTSVEPEGMEFEQAAQEVLGRLRYAPGRYRGRPVAVRLKQRFVFKPSENDNE